MLSRQLRRIALDSRSSLPPTFLCPWVANLTTDAHTPSPNLQTPIPPTDPSPLRQAASNVSPTTKSHISPQRAPSPPDASPSSVPKLHDSIISYLPLLRAQKQIYANIQIHGKSYLVTEGDTVRLPFLMHGVDPGDVLRLNRAITLGSRDFTLRSPGRLKRGKSGTAGSEVVLDPAPAGPVAASANLRAHAAPPAVIVEDENELKPGEVFVPHQLAGQTLYLDERLFVCRATVMGVESEPLRIMQKTKRRQRHVRQVKSKHKYTVLRIKELSVSSLEEIGHGDVDTSSV